MRLPRSSHLTQLPWEKEQDERGSGTSKLFPILGTISDEKAQKKTGGRKVFQPFLLFLRTRTVVGKSLWPVEYILSLRLLFCWMFTMFTLSEVRLTPRGWRSGQFNHEKAAIVWAMVSLLSTLAFRHILPAFQFPLRSLYSKCCCRCCWCLLTSFSRATRLLMDDWDST